MKQKNTLILWKRVLLLFALILPLVQSFGQDSRILAKWQSDSNKHVTNAKAIDSYDNSYAQLQSYAGAILGAGAYKSDLTAVFPSVQSAGTTAYIELNGDKSLFEVLLGGSLGKILSGILDLVVGGSQAIEVQFYNKDALVEVYKVGSDLSSAGVQVLQNNKSNILVINPGSQYDRIKVVSGYGAAVLLGETFTVDLYNIYTYKPGSSSVCDPAVGTSFDGGGGLSLEVGNVEKLSLSKAIDGDMSTFSVLQSSVLNLKVGSYLAQDFYFSNVGDTDASFNITLSPGTELLDLNVLGAIEVVALNNKEEVYRKSLQSGLLNGTDILSLFNNKIGTLTFMPGKAFNQVRVIVKSTVNLNLLSSGLKIYEVQRFGGADSGCSNPLLELPEPTEGPFHTPACVGKEGLVSFENVDFPNHAVDMNNESYAVLTAANPELLGILGQKSSDASIHMSWGKDLPANTPTYIRLDTDKKILNALLGGALGPFVEDVSNLLLGNYFFNVDVYNSSSKESVLSRVSSNSFAKSPSDIKEGYISVVKDKEGRFYLKVVPASAYSSIKITNKVNAGLLNLGNGVSRMKVYDMCREINTTEALCGLPISTSYDSNGITISVLGGLLENKFENAIDGNADTFSSLIGDGGLIDLKLVGSVAQNFDWGIASKSDASFNITLKMASGAVNLSLLGGINIVAYLGDSEVYRSTLNSGLVDGVDALGLLAAGEKNTFVFGPGRSFDRVAVVVNQGVNLNLLGNGIEIYDVQRYDEDFCKNPLLKIEQPSNGPLEAPKCASELVDFQNVDFPNQAIDGNNESYASLKAANGPLLNLGDTSSMIHMKYDSTLQANTVSYIRIDSDKDFLDALLGGSLGKLLGDIAGKLLGDFVIGVEAYSGDTKVLEESSTNGFDGNKQINQGSVTLVQDNIGRYYLAVKPASGYDSVKITARVDALLGTGGVKTLNVYNMCYETGQDICFPAQFTSFTSNGINLGVGEGGDVLKRAGVFNPYYAIDDNSSSFSEISPGLIGVGASVNQLIDFPHPSQINDILKIRLQLGTKAPIDLGLLGESKVITYSNGVKQEEFSLEKGIINNLDLLGLLNSGSIETLEFTTTKPFDRVAIAVSRLASLNTGTSLRIYDVKRYGDSCPEIITESPFEVPVCATNIIKSENVSGLSNLFTDNFDSYATINSKAGFLLGLGKEIGVLELGYQEAVPAGVTSYIRFDVEPGMLQKLLAGSLGNLASGLLDNILLGAHSFKVEVIDPNGTTVILSGSSDGKAPNVEGGSIRVMFDKQGRSYLAITPEKAYQSVRITDTNTAISGITSQDGSMNVYGMCYETSSNSCQDVFATSFEYSGLALSVPDFSGSGVSDAERAIDDNSDNFSELSLGTLAVGSKVSQLFYFNTPSNAGEIVDIKFSLSSNNIIDVALLKGLQIVAYKGDVKVDDIEFTTGLINGVDVLGLLNQKKVVSLPFAPKSSYDRISVSLESLSSVNVISSVKIHDVSRNCQTLDQRIVSWKSFTIDGKNDIDSVSGGENIEYSIYVKNEGTSDLTSVEIKDILPQGINGFVSSSNPNVVFDAKTREVTFVSHSGLAVGQTQKINFSVTVDSNLEGIGQIVNIANVKVNNSDKQTPSYPPLDNTNPDQGADVSKNTGTIIFVKPLNEVTITKIGRSNNADGAEKAEVGDELTYTITVANGGNKSLRNFTVLDVLQNTEDVIVSIVDADGGEVKGNTITYSIAELKAKQDRVITVITKVEKVADQASGKILNTAEIIYISPEDGKEMSADATFGFDTNCQEITSSLIEVTQNEVCYGQEVTLSASIKGKDYINFLWYADKELTEQIGQGASKEITLQADFNTTVYLVAQGSGVCFIGDAREYVVDLEATFKASIANTSPVDICFGAKAELTASEVQGEKVEYFWFHNGVLMENSGIFDENQQQIDIAKSNKIAVLAEGDYTLAVRVDDGCTSAISDPVKVSFKPEVGVSLEGLQRISTEYDKEVVFPTVKNRNGATVTWYKLGADGKFIEENNLSGTTKVFAQQEVGIHTYFVVAVKDDCEEVFEVRITVFDPASCPVVYNRNWAKESTSWASIITGWVTNASNAINGDPTSYSTITIGVGALGIGTTWQDVYFNEVQAAGTPVTIKLGKEYSGLALAGALSVVGLDENGKEIGVIKPVQGGLLDVLAASNIVEYTFIPANRHGAQKFKGVRVSGGALVSVAQNLNLYGAYTKVEGLPGDQCTHDNHGMKSNIADVLYGVQDVGLGVASATASVVNPYHAVDNNPETYALINRGVAVLNVASLTTIFKSEATMGDELRIVLEVPSNPILSIELLKGFKIQRYLGEDPVGEPVGSDWGILGLRLLGLTGGYENRATLIVEAFPEPYDRVKISYGSVLGILGDATRIFDVDLVPTFQESTDGFLEDTNPDDDQPALPLPPFPVCDNGPLTLTPNDGCTAFRVFTSETEDIELPVLDSQDNTGLIFDVSGLSVGAHTLWVQSYRNGCPVGPRIEFRIVIQSTPEFTGYTFKNKPLMADENGDYSARVNKGDTRSTFQVVGLFEGKDFSESSNLSYNWEMKTIVEVDGVETEVWGVIPFASFDSNSGVLTMNIPRNGKIDGVDYSGAFYEIRGIVTSKDTGKCEAIGDIIHLEIAKRSNVKSNLNVTQQIK